MGFRGMSSPRRIFPEQFEFACPAGNGGFFQRGEMADGDLFLIEPDVREIRASFVGLSEHNAFDTKFIGAPGACIHGILRRCDFPKVFDLVIQRVLIPVVNDRLGPHPVDQAPNHPMGHQPFAPEPDNSITVSDVPGFFPGIFPEQLAVFEDIIFAEEFEFLFRGNVRVQNTPVLAK